MSERRSEEPEQTAAVPRDYPDQQVGGVEGPDRWDAHIPGETDLEEEQVEGSASDGTSGADAPGEVPDTDQAGTGRRGRVPGSHPDAPVPEEPSD